MKTSFLFFIIIFNASTLFAQKEYYNWDFGGDNVITFNTPDREPDILTKSILTTWEGCSSISDSKGKFLFSTNGLWVFSYIENPTIMKFNDGIYDPITLQMNGGASATQSSIIVKKPESDSIYYIFTVGSKTDPKCSELGYNYSIIDLGRNGGKGEIIEINNFLYGPSTEQITAVRHGNGIDIWIITHRENSNVFEVFLLTKDGVNKQEVISSSAGTKYSTYDGIGYLKSNLQGNLLANAGFNDKIIEILKFDNLTGKINLLVNINLEQEVNEYIGKPYGVEFSPDNTKLYTSSSCSSFLAQLDITDLNTEYILKNIHYISKLESSYGGLQIAPNGKIYVVSNFTKLCVINNPNKKGDSCDFSITDKKFNSNNRHFGLPNSVAEITDFSIKIMSNIVCEGDDLILNVIPAPDYTSNKYYWTLPDGSEFIGKTIKISNANLTHSGLYKIKVDIKDSLLYDSFNIEVHQPPFVKISGNQTFCKNTSTTLSANQGKGYKYKWSTGDTTASIIVKTEGKYILTIENEFGCVSQDSITVSYGGDLEFSMRGETKLCTGDTLLLSTDLTGDEFIYDWSTGETTPSILVTKGGKYILKVKSDAGCEGIDSITIEEFESPVVKFEKAQYTICKGDDFVLKPIETKPEYEYIWSDGQTGAERNFDESVELYLIAKSQNGCTDTTYAKVNVLEMPVASILADKTEVCFGEKITLKAENYKPEFDYKWSNGEKTESINVSESGIYKLIVSNQELCADTAEITVTVYPDLALELTADNTNLCFSDSTKIYPKAKYNEYLWSTGETTESITVHDAGVYQLIVKNEFGCSDSAQIEISKFDANVTFDKEKLVFDELCLGDSKIENLQLKIETGTEFVVNRIYTKTNNFDIMNINSHIKSYKNGDAVDLEIVFEPNDAEEFFDTLFVESVEPCKYKAALPIYGSSKALFRFSLPDISTIVGQKIEIPINSVLICQNASKLTSDYEITISIDKAYFQADSVKFGEIIKNEITGNDRILTIHARAEFEKLSIDLKPINIIYGQALIGRSESVPLVIENVIFPNSRYFPENLNGSLLLEGCVNDISGLQIFKPTTLKVAPNPADGDLKVTVGTQEEGTFSIIIYDFQGREVVKSEFSRLNKIYEEKDFSFNINNLGTGMYSVHLTAPWTIKREQLVIVK